MLIKDIHEASGRHLELFRVLREDASSYIQHEPDAANDVLIALAKAEAAMAGTRKLVQAQLESLIHEQDQCAKLRDAVRVHHGKTPDPDKPDVRKRACRTL